MTPYGARCYCMAGQQPNGTQCIDFDECSVDDACDQICKNTIGSFECSCVAGYNKIKNLCKAVNGKKRRNYFFYCSPQLISSRWSFAVPVGEAASTMFLMGNKLIVQNLNDISKSIHEYPVANAQSFEILHRNRTVCIVSGPKSDNETVSIHCHSFDDFSITWQLQIPDIFSTFESK